MGVYEEKSCAEKRPPIALDRSGKCSSNLVEPCLLGNSKSLRLSDAQIEVLLKGVDHKLSRSTMGWSYDDRVSPTDGVRIHSPATIKSLWKRGLLDSNFADP